MAQLQGVDAFKIFENVHTALAKALLSSGSINPEKVSVERFEDGSLKWTFEMDEEGRAKALFNWLKESIGALKDFYGFSKIEERKIDNTEVVMVYMPSPTGKEEFPAAFWSKGSKLYWLESGHDPEAFEDLLYTEIKSA